MKRRRFRRSRRRREYKFSQYERPFERVANDASLLLSLLVIPFAWIAEKLFKKFRRSKPNPPRDRTPLP
jgi:hypothetical protein